MRMRWGSRCTVCQRIYTWFWFSFSLDWNIFSISGELETSWILQLFRKIDFFITNLTAWAIDKNINVKEFQGLQVLEQRHQEGRKNSLHTLFWTQWKSVKTETCQMKWNVSGSANGHFFFRLFNWKMSGKHYSFISMALSGTFISWYFLSSFDMRLDSDIPEWCEVMSIYCEYWGNKGFKYVVSVMRHQ